MDYSVKALRENDVKFVKLTFSDVFGRQKNVSVVVDELERAFAGGYPVYGEAVTCRAGDESRIRLFPDATTLYLLPWRPQAGRVVSVLCDIRNEGGAPYECDSADVLRRTAEAAAKAGLEVSVGTACDFYVLECDEHGPTPKPYDEAGYCDAAPLDRCENIRRDIVLSLETMGIRPTSSRHERGKGQNRVIFRPSDPMNAAKDLLVYKSAVRNICVRDGVYATFMPMPFDDGIGSGMSVTIDLTAGADEAKAAAFAAGIEGSLGELLAFTNPTVNSFRRLKARFGGGRPALTREGTAVSVYIPDDACNPYLVLALLISAGLNGISGVRPMSAEPKNLTEAAAAAGKSKLVRSVLGDKFTETYIAALLGDAKSLGADPDLKAERAKYLDR